VIGHQTIPQSFAAYS